MNDSEKSIRFWIANGVLALAMIMLLFIEQLWGAMGFVAMLIWIGLAAGGAFLFYHQWTRTPGEPVYATGKCIIRHAEMMIRREGVTTPAASKTSLIELLRLRTITRTYR